MTTPTTRLYTVSRVIGHTLSLVGAAQATDAADAVRVALGLTRRPALDHSGPDGSGYAVGRRRYVAAAEHLHQHPSPPRSRRRASAASVVIPRTWVRLTILVTL